MPQALDSADRKLLIGAGVLLALLVVTSVLFLPQSSEVSEVPSSYSPGWGGAEGAFLLLQDIGYRVTRWEHSPLELPPDASDGVLILAEPVMPAAEDERYALRDFLLRGGRIIATGPDAADFLPEASKFQHGDPFEDTQSFDALIPSPLVRGAPQITMMAPSAWEPQSLRQIVVYGNEDTAAVVTYRFGKGEVIWWASATPLTNQSIRDSGNLAFFLNCIGPPAKVQVFWDEYFHGMRGSLVTFLSRTPVLWGTAQFGLIFAAVIFTFSRRLGPIRPPVAQSRLSPLEFVDTLGDLYASADVSSAAVGIAYRRFRFILARKLGLPMDVPFAELANRASENFGWDEAPLLRTLGRCEQAIKDANFNSKESVELVQQLYDYSARLDVRRITANERQTA